MLINVFYARAKVKLSPLFTDNAVMQQQTSAPIWGDAKPNSKVTVVTSWDNKKYKTTADAVGHFMLKVTTPKAGGPYEITISDGKPVVLHNILIGEVWICSGQSNMEMPMQGWAIKMNQREIAESGKYVNIRLLKVKNKISQREETTFEAEGNGWVTCSPETVKNFSATGFFFGANINESQRVPVGLVMTCWGATMAEAWTEAKELSSMPDFATAYDDAKLADHDPEKYKVVFNDRVKKRRQLIDANEKQYMQNGHNLFLEPNLSTDSIMKIYQPSKLETDGLSSFDGLIWLRREIILPDNWAGKEAKIHLGKIDDNDITYFNGQEVGSMNGCGANRVYTVPAELVKPGKNIIVVRVEDTASDGGIYGADSIYIENETVAQRIGLNGIWYAKPTTNYVNYPVPVSILNNRNAPSGLYNAMIRPLVPYAIRGAIWYQGEANADRPYQYRDLLPLTIDSWRRAWHQNFPFYIVQLANYKTRHEEPEESNWALLREAQEKVAETTANSGMIVNIDLGMANDIHPTSKKEVGRRLSLVARAKTYGEQVEYLGPTFESYQIQGDTVICSFSHAKGMQVMEVQGNGHDTKVVPASGKELKGFALAGADHKFHWANAVIEGDHVLVFSPDVPYPLAVRYAWADNPNCNLYNAEGLPASPFRTDVWR